MLTNKQTKQKQNFLGGGNESHFINTNLLLTTFSYNACPLASYIGSAESFFSHFTSACTAIGMMTKYTCCVNELYCTHPPKISSIWMTIIIACGVGSCLGRTHAPPPQIALHRDLAAVIISVTMHTQCGVSAAAREGWSSLSAVFYSPLRRHLFNNSPFGAATFTSARKQVHNRAYLETRRHIYVEV